MPTFDAVPGDTVTAGLGVMRFIGNRELDDLRRRASETEALHKSQPDLSALAILVETVFERNKRERDRVRIDEQMLANLRQRTGAYDPEKLAQLEEMSSTKIFMCLTGVKCRAAKAWMSDVLASVAEKPWKLEPTPLPDLPPQVGQAVAQRAMAKWMQMLSQGMLMQPDEVFAYSSKIREELDTAVAKEAKRRAGLMDKLINDQMVEGSWEDAFDDYLVDMTTLKAGIIKGPILRMSPNLVWGRGPGNRTIPVTNMAPKHHFYCVSPFDFYPSGSSVSIQDGDSVEIVRMTRFALARMKTIPGWDADAIDAVLVNWRQLSSEYTPTDYERAQLHNKADQLSMNEGLISGKEFWGIVQGQTLIEEGMERDLGGKPIDPLAEYPMCVIKIGSYIVFKGFNTDPLWRKPYSKGVWEKITGSFWGNGIPELMADLQSICNASIRSMVNNLGITSGPQVALYDINRVAPGEDVTQLYPWKIWQFISKGMGTEKPIEFFNVESHGRELMLIYDFFAKLADDYTGIPAYSYGNERVSGAARTLGGLSMLMNSAARGIKQVLTLTHRDVIQDVIQRMFDWNMMYSPNEEAKGDIRIVPTGILSAIIREQTSARRMDFLARTAIPVDLALTGLRGRANVLREAAKDLDMAPDAVVKDDEAVAALEQGMAAQAAQGQQGAGQPGLLSAPQQGQGAAQ